MKLLENGGVLSPRGFLAGVASAGLRPSGANDVALVVSQLDCTGAGVFTRNQVIAAPVLLDQSTLKRNATHLRGVVINAGNANACTGEPGRQAAEEMQRAAAEALRCDSTQFLVMSTGVIGVQLPAANVTAAIARAAQTLEADGTAVADAIMTTDRLRKSIAVELTLAGGVVTIGGVAKGAGMIHPNMATMLGVITTDAIIPATAMQVMLNKAVNTSFNRITVDGDTSTNDTVLFLANGASRVALLKPDDHDLVQDALNFVCTELAKMIVRDGEGATKFVELRVSSAHSEADALDVASTVATSPLVKTALAGGDANWGRIVAATGRSRARIDPERLALWISGDREEWLQLVNGGMPTAYAEADAAAIFAGSDLFIHIDIGSGFASGTMWTCDLGHEYVTINADYRT